MRFDQYKLNHDDFQNDQHHEHDRHDQHDKARYPELLLYVLRLLMFLRVQESFASLAVFARALSIGINSFTTAPPAA